MTTTTSTAAAGYKWKHFNGIEWVWETYDYLTLADAYYSDRSFDLDWKLFHFGPEGYRLIETNAYPQGADH